MKYLITTSLVACIITVADFQLHTVLPLIAGGISLYWILSRFIGMQQEIKFLKEENLYFVASFRNIRNPITLVHTPLKTVCNDYFPDKIPKELSLAIRNIDCLDEHFTSLMNLKLLSIHSKSMKIEEHELGNFLKNKIDSLKEHAANKLLKVKIETTFRYGSVWFDQSKISPVIEYFVKNAIDDAEPQKDITIFTSLNNEYWEIKINNSSNCSLMKNILCKRLIKLCKGKVLVNNQSFTVSLRFPVRYSGEEQPIRVMTHIAMNQEEEKIDTLYHKNFPKRNSTKPIVVLADSNDDFRFYLEERLSENFIVKSFNNGPAALAYIKKEEYPDIVICDMMLHEMCGYELSSRLKTSGDTSIIPVILYGSHIDTDRRSKREASLADTFLHIPFNIEDLKTEMSVLIKNSRSLRKAFLRKVFGEQFLEVEKEEVLDGDNFLFINRVKDLILLNIDKENLKIDDIASELNMSRTAFFNKWKALTGEAPKFFIYRIRMEKARELLESGKYSVNVIPEMIGLKNLKNFRSKYKEYFGITPSGSIKRK